MEEGRGAGDSRRFVMNPPGAGTSSFTHRPTRTRSTASSSDPPRAGTWPRSGVGQRWPPQFPAEVARGGGQGRRWDQEVGQSQRAADPPRRRGRSPGHTAPVRTHPGRTTLTPLTSPQNHHGPRPSRGDGPASAVQGPAVQLAGGTASRRRRRGIGLDLAARREVWSAQSMGAERAVAARRACAVVKNVVAAGFAPGGRVVAGFRQPAAGPRSFPEVGRRVWQLGPAARGPPRFMCRPPW